MNPGRVPCLGPARPLPGMLHPKAEPQERLIQSSTGVQIQTFHLPPSSDNHKLAFVAHPLGRLGGNWRDPTAQSVGRLCFRLGYGVVWVNSRGRGKSQGWASFSFVFHPSRVPENNEAADEMKLVSQIPEAQDFQSVVDSYTSDQPDVQDVLLIGYSAGSLSALWSHAPPRIQRCRRVLVSYPYSVIWALTVWRAAPFIQKLDQLATTTSEPTLAIYGDCDEFTSRTSYRTWRDALSDKGDAISQ